MKPLEFEVEGGGGGGGGAEDIWGERSGGYLGGTVGDLSSSTEYKREL